MLSSILSIEESVERVDSLERSRSLSDLADRSEEKSGLRQFL